MLTIPLPDSRGFLLAGQPARQEDHHHAKELDNVFIHRAPRGE